MTEEIKHTNKRDLEISWEKLSEILEKSGNSIKGEKIEEITLINPRKIKLTLERNI